MDVGEGNEPACTVARPPSRQRERGVLAVIRSHLRGRKFMRAGRGVALPRGVHRGTRMLGRTWRQREIKVTGVIVVMLAFVVRGLLVLLFLPFSG